MKRVKFRSGWGLAAMAPLVLAGGVAAQEPEVYESGGAQGPTSEDLSNDQTRANLQRQIEELRGEVDRLRGEGDRDWMNQRRREEVRAVVDDLIGDAEGREAEGFPAGHDGHFYLGSPDGDFLLELAGHLQVRYIYNDRDDSGDDDNLGGFQLRRIKFKGDGHIYTPKLKYDFSLAGDRDSSTTVFEDYLLEYDFAENWAIRAGRWKQPFALQNVRSSSRQLAVERSTVHELFRVDRSEGVMLSYGGDAVNVYGAVNDGRSGKATDFDANNVDIAGTGRVELLLAGEWDQFADASSWSGDPLGAMLGGAVHYQVGETGTTAANDNLLLWTADLSIEGGGFGSLFAVYGGHTDGGMSEDFDDYGFLAEAGYMVVPDTLEPFLRYELILQDDSRPGVESGASEDATNIVTAGFNWYQFGHDAKFTLDAVYALDPLTGNLVGSDDGVSTGLGLRPDAPGEDGQLAIRAQYQLKF